MPIDFTGLSGNFCPPLIGILDENAFAESEFGRAQVACD
jgi:hypothetical protein